MAAFDMGFNFRATAGFVADQAFAVPVIAAHIFPHLYTNANGLSINAGWLLGTGVTGADRSNTNDPRIAGENFTLSTTDTFRIDLGSGSAPGAGLYTLDLAVGDATVGGVTQGLRVRDNVTDLITVPNLTTAAGHFIDATVVDVAASTTWAGTTVNKTFASTTCNIVVNPNTEAIVTTLAHFRLTLVPPAGGLAWKLAGDHAALAGRGGLAA